MSDQARFDQEVSRQLYELEQEWLSDQKSQIEWIFFLETLNGQAERLSTPE